MNKCFFLIGISVFLLCSSAFSQPNPVYTAIDSAKGPDGSIWYCYGDNGPGLSKYDGETYISGTLTKSDVWTLENSPYYIIDHLTIPRGVGIVIEPGVEVRCGSGIYIEGSMKAIGEPDKLIVFTGQISSFNVNGTGSTFQYCRFMSIEHGMGFSDGEEDPGLPIDISHCEIRLVYDELSISGVEVNLCNNLIIGDGSYSRNTASDTGIKLHSSWGRIQNNIVREFHNGLCYYGSPGLNIVNNVFEECYRGIGHSFSEWEGDLTTIHPNIHHNVFSNVDTMFFEYISGWRVLSFRIEDDDYGNISANPLFVESLKYNSILNYRTPWGDYRLLAGSPCIDAGDPTMFDSDGSPSDIGRYSGPEYIVSDQTAVEEGENIPAVFTLMPNYPNPFNPSTTIRFTLPQYGQVSLDVYNVSGQKVATLVDQKMDAGTHRVVFDGAGLASGVYFYRFVSAEYSKTGKMLLIK